MDLTPLLISALKADPTVASWVGTAVFGFVAPKDALPPLVVVSQNQSSPTTNPQTVWWDAMVTVDIHSEHPGDTASLTGAVIDLLPTIVGSHETFVVADSRIDSIEVVADDGWTPIRYRQVVTVDLTAREP